ncbi:hypothetical protein V5R04_11660 [Jonesiaceae bacterium BS-20]|uniref:Uncharacterized protein n=1 Tax=Jonesiaceae bacterium BS-20 TaxID=3120821 RepID=A0AAU7DRP2_9MICO
MNDSDHPAVPRSQERFAPPHLRTVKAAPLPYWPRPETGHLTLPVEDQRYLDLAAMAPPGEARSESDAAAGRRSFHPIMLVLTSTLLIVPFLLAGVLSVFAVDPEPFYGYIGFIFILGVVSALIWVTGLIVIGIEKIQRKRRRS